MIFHVSVEPSEDGWIVAQCPALPGCVSQGRDEKEALENVKEAITAWLWAEDQKAVKALGQNGTPVVVAVWIYAERIAWHAANISGKEAVKAFSKAGWQVMGQVGSHEVMTKPDVRANLSVPQHKELAAGTLRALIRAAEMTVEEFLSLLWF